MKSGLGEAPTLLKEVVEGFAHEVKNPLASVRGALKVLEERIPPQDPNRKLIEQVLWRVQDINKALGELIDFTRIAEPDVSPTDVNQVLEKSLRGIRSNCEKTQIEVEKHFSINMPEIEIDAKQIELAFLYLFLDILKAVTGGGKLVVRSSWDPHGRILVEVEDTGSPIPEIHMERLFKPFLSTKGRGSGIGLSMAKRILNQNGGVIQAGNRGEQGMTFTILFPLPISENDGAK